MISFKTLVAAAVVSFGASAAFAQTTTAPATKAPTATTAPATGTAKKAEKAPRSAESLACSAQADAKKLHGKERSKFRKKCIKDAKTAAKKAS